MESKGHMVGVVVSWDPEMRAPAEWVDKMHSNSEARVRNLRLKKFMISAFEGCFLISFYISIGHYSREDPSLQSPVQWTWTVVSASGLPPSNTTGAHHWTAGEYRCTHLTKKQKCILSTHM